MIKKTFYFLLVFLILPLGINASNIEVSSLESIVNVLDNRSATIEENINAYIVNETPTFKRIIDKNLYIYRQDKSKTLNNVIVSNVTSSDLNNDESTAKKENILFNIKEKKDTIQAIKLKYDYNLGKDKSIKYDEFYYNIASNFDSVVSNISFEITLPKKFDIKHIDFLIDGNYKLEENSVLYTVEDNVITGYLNMILDKNSTFSVRIELPEGTFIGGTDNFNNFSYLYILFPLITFVLVLLYWLRYAKGNKKNKKYVYYPPNDFDPVEIGYLYKGLTGENDLINNIIYLANNGYLQIEENTDGYKLGTDNSFKFIKLKDYEKNNATQKLLFEGIFKNSDIVDLKDIEYNYNDKIIDIKSMIDNKNNRIKLFNIDINKVKLISMISLIISTLVLNIEPIKQLTNSYLLVPVSTFIMVFGLAILFVFNLKGILKILLGIAFIGGVAYISINTLLIEPRLLIIYCIELCLIIVSSILYSKLPLRTKFGNEKLGETEGFRSSLLNMNKVQLKEILKEQPNYFYDMVPYAIVFDIINEWISKGKGIINNRPVWHISQEEFNLNKECRFFKNIVYTTSKVMIKAIYAKKESSQIEFKRDQINSKLNNME